MTHNQVGFSGEIPASRAIKAVIELAEWLDKPIDTIVTQMGLTVSTYYRWRHHPDSYLHRSQGQRLFRIHAVVDLLFREFGAEQMQIWLSSGTPSSLSLMAAESETAALDELELRALDLFRQADPTNTKLLHLPSDEEIDRLVDDLPLLVSG